MNPGGGGSKNTAAPEMHAGLDSADIVPGYAWNGLLDSEGLPYKFDRYGKIIINVNIVIKMKTEIEAIKSSPPYSFFYLSFPISLYLSISIYLSLLFRPSTSPYLSIFHFFPSQFIFSTHLFFHKKY